MFKFQVLIVLALTVSLAYCGSLCKTYGSDNRNILIIFNK